MTSVKARRGEEGGSEGDRSASGCQREEVTTAPTAGGCKQMATKRALTMSRAG